MFRVRFATKSEGVASIDWEPVKGDGFECGRREALRRFNHLLDEGLRCAKVDDVVPWLVEIVDEDGALMLGITTEPNDALTGKWARDLVEDYRARLQRLDSEAA